jgi:hypothetical protein
MECMVFYSKVAERRQKSMGSFTISVIVFLCIFGGALFGFFLHTVLPEPHLGPESQQVINLGMGIIGTMSALVLGLLVASAKGTYDAENNELIEASGKIIFLDQTLRNYGPEANETRVALRQTVESTINRLWPHERRHHVQIDARGATALFRQIEQLKPQDDNQRATKDRAMATAVSLSQTRSLAVVQQSISTSKPLLASDPGLLAYD